MSQNVCYKKNIKSQWQTFSIKQIMRDSMLVKSTGAIYQPTLQTHKHILMCVYIASHLSLRRSIQDFLYSRGRFKVAEISVHAFFKFGQNNI